MAGKAAVAAADRDLGKLNLKDNSLITFWKVPTILTGGRALFLLESCCIEGHGAASLISELTGSLTRH